MTSRCTLTCVAPSPLSSSSPSLGRPARALRFTLFHVQFDVLVLSNDQFNERFLWPLDSFGSSALGKADTALLQELFTPAVAEQLAEEPRVTQILADEFEQLVGRACAAFLNLTPFV